MVKGSISWYAFHVGIIKTISDTYSYLSYLLLRFQSQKWSKWSFWTLFNCFICFYIVLENAIFLCPRFLCWLIVLPIVAFLYRKLCITLCSHRKYRRPLVEIIFTCVLNEGFWLDVLISLLAWKWYDSYFYHFARFIFLSIALTLLW